MQSLSGLGRRLATEKAIPIRRIGSQWIVKELPWRKTAVGGERTGRPLLVSRTNGASFICDHNVVDKINIYIAL